LQPINERLASVRRDHLGVHISTHFWEEHMFDRLFGGVASAVPAVGVGEAWERLSQEKPAPSLIDVREEWEFRGGHAKGAKNIPLSQLGKRIGEVPRDSDILLICQSGNRSLSAAKLLQRQGITRAFNVSGGTSTWRMQRLPME
jgi:rhodanese-related sulfurtransferase